MKPVLVGLAGGSGSGKTTVAKYLQENLGEKTCQVLFQDSYYIDQSAKFDHDGGAVNFDHPSSLDFDLMGEHLKALSEGKTIQVPIYDFATHRRKEETIKMEPEPIILVDGILIFSQPQVQKKLDHLIYVSATEELRFQRRLERDVRERGRTPEGVHEQFFKQVKPMHDEFVGPSKQYATIIVENNTTLEHLIDQIDQKILPTLR